MTIRIDDRIPRDPVADRAELLAGLRATPAAIPPKYFYDRLGSALYNAICELPEYYPTRTEHAIFDANRVAIANVIGTGTQLVDLGTGDGAKAESWLPFLVPARYLAVDIAGSVVERTLTRLSIRFPDLETAGIVTDFTKGLDLTDDLTDAPVTFFYPGSSIGNFTPEEAIPFMHGIQQACEAHADSGLLIGVDMKKDARRLSAAYDDALGVTASFNRNVLNHVNRLLESDFDPRAFAHCGFYVEERGRVEMHLEARSRQVVRLDGATRVFEAGERIHTENSYKYTPDEFEILLACAGFATVHRWQDEDRDFAVFYAT